MSKRFLIGSVALLALCAGGGPATADDDWTVKWSNGFKVESADKQFKLSFGGRVQADYTFASADRELEDAFGADAFEDGFEFRRARLFVSGTIYERVAFKAQYDFGGGDASFKDVWIALVQDWGQVRFGHFKEYFSLEEQTSSKYLALLERSLPVEAFSPSRNSGVGVHGGGDRVNWGIGYFYDADDFGVSSSEDNTNLTARVAFRPLLEDEGRRLIHLGAAVSSKDTGSTFRFRARPEAHFTTRLIDTGSFDADSALLLGAEIAGVFDRFWFAGEWIQNDVDAPAVGDPTFDGYYAQVGFFLTDDYRRYKAGDGAFDRQKPGSPWLSDGGGGAWEIVARVSSLDLTDEGIVGGEQDNFTVGVNWYPNPATRLMINYVNADVDFPVEEPAGAIESASADFILVRWQVDF